MEETKNINETPVNPESPETQETPESPENPDTPADQDNAETPETPEDRIAALEKEVAAHKDAYLRLMAEFDNYRKNTAKDKQALLKYGGEGVLKELLPVIDDFERALSSLEKSDDIEGVKEGVNLIYQKFTGFLAKNRVTEIPAAVGDKFDDTIHEAITTFPAPTPDLKDKIIDCPTKGYKLDDKVIRFAKVVVGA